MAKTTAGEKRRPLRAGELTRRQAASQIQAILARVPDFELQQPDRVEQATLKDGPSAIAWYGGHGFHIRPVTMQSKRDAYLDCLDLFFREWINRERVRRYGKNYVFRDGAQIGGAA